MTQTQILSNGWPRTASIDELLELLGQRQLEVDRNAIEYEGFGRFRCWGNFTNHSHVFNIRSNDPAVLRRLVVAILKNRLRADYIADAQFRGRAAADYHALLMKSGDKIAYQRAIDEWRWVGPEAAGAIRGERVPPDLLSALLEGSGLEHVESSTATA